MFALHCRARSRSPALAAARKTEHGVNRDKLDGEGQEGGRAAQRDHRQQGRQRAGRRSSKGRPNFSKWMCGWRAAGLYPGQVPYACAGKAVWKRKGDTWRIDRCENQRQPEAPLLDSPNPPPVFGFNDNWIFQPTQALNMLEDSGATVARTSLAWRGVEGEQGKFNWYGSDQLYQHLLDRGIRPLWVLIDAPCWAQAEPAGMRQRQGQLHPDVAPLRRLRRFRGRSRQALPAVGRLRGLERAQLPAVLGRPAGAQRLREDAEDDRHALHEQVPGATVVSAGLSPHSDNDTSGSIGFRDFLISMFENGAAQKADAIGIHPYPGVGPRRRLRRRRAGLPRQDPERPAPLQRLLDAALGDRVRRLDDRRHRLQRGSAGEGADRALRHVPPRQWHPAGDRPPLRREPGRSAGARAASVSSARTSCPSPPTAR